jgi:methanogenic corrinoid protein MtbC1
MVELERFKMAAEILDSIIKTVAGVMLAGTAIAFLSGMKPVDALERGVSPVNALIGIGAGYVFATGNRRFAR